MEAKAQARFVRVTPQKARRVVDLIRGKQAVRGRGGAEVRTAGRERAGPQGCGERDRQRSGEGRPRERAFDEGDLFVSVAFVDEGPTLKRFRPRAQGRASQILKRTSHITVVSLSVKRRGAR